MREFRKKQKRLKTIMNAVVIATAIYFLVFIGIEPAIAKYSNTLFLAMGYIANALVVICLILLFSYFSKYGKSDSFLESIEYELSDVGYYITSRPEKEQKAYVNAVVEDIRNNGFSVDEKVTVNDFDFSAVGRKGKEIVYIANIDDLDKNDVVAYIDSVIYDITAVNIKRKANAIIVFVTNKADDGAVSLSKMITPLGKKETIKIANAIVETDTSRVYFLGNKISKHQQMIANYVMNCDVPIKDKYKANEKLPFQYELEEKMKSFNIKDFKNGTFYAH